MTHRNVYQSTSGVNVGRSSGCGGFDAGCAFTPEPGRSTAVASGYADSNQLKVGGYTKAEDYLQAPGALAISHSQVKTSFMITPGSSGLAAGTDVNLRWNYHLDGSTHLSGTTYTEPTNALASVTSKAAIRRVSGFGLEEDPNLAAVDFNLNLQMSHNQPNVNYPYTSYSYGYQSWSAYSNSGFEKNEYVNYNDTYQGTAADMFKTVTVDSSFFGLDYIPLHVKVGEKMEIFLDLNLFSSMSGGADPFGSNARGYSRNNYFGTLASSILLGPGYETSGLQIRFDEANAVPEPGTAALVVLGVLGLAISRRKQ